MDNLENEIDRLHKVHEDFLVALCQILHIHYEDVTEQEILAQLRSQLMNTIKDSSMYNDRSRFPW